MAAKPMDWESIHPLGDDSSHRLGGYSKYFRSVESKQLRGHEKQVHCVGWNCKGTKLATGSLDKTARVWSVGSRGVASEVTLSGHTGAVEQVAWHPFEDKVLASASADETVRVWDARSGGCSHKIETKGPNISLCWSPDGKHIACGNKNDIVSIIDARTMKVSRNLGFSTFEINQLAFDGSSEHLLLSTGNGSVDIRKFPSMEKVHVLKAHTGICYCIDIDKQQKYLATGGADALVGLWDMDEMVCVRSFNRIDSRIRTLGFSHDSKFIASASDDPRIDISEVESGRTVHTIETRAEMNALAWSPQSLLLAYAENNTKESRDPGNVVVFGFA